MKDIFWAKKAYVDGQYFWLPLLEHLKDVRFVMARLWELWLDESQRQLIEGSLTGVDTSGKDLAMFLATVHDLGKCSPAFQSQKSFDASSDLDNFLLERLEGQGFTGLSKLFLTDRQSTHHSKISQLLLENFSVLEDISSIVGAHHGKPVGEDENVKRLAYSHENNIYQKSSGKKVEELWKKYQKEIFDWALEINNFKSVEELPRVKQQAQVILTGLLIMADWIASNERYFPLIDIEAEGVLDRKARERDGWTKWFKTFTWESSQVDREEIYKKRFGYDRPRDSQRIFMDIVEGCNDPGIFIFEAPMGLGKTEAALIAVEQLAYKLNKSGIFFGLPTQATSNAIFSRLADWLKSVSEDFGEQLPIRLSHGKSELNEEFSYLKKNIDIESGAEGTLIVNQWFSGKKTVALDDFVIGTIDQLLMMALKQKHLFLRHLGFSKKVVVIDEVHAYDEFSSEYLYRALSWLGFYKVPVVILSATLPFKKREKLIEAYQNARNKDVNLKTDSYPLITYTDGKEIKQFSDFERGEDKEVEIIKWESEDIIALVRELYKDEGNIGIIVNTVKKAQELAKKLQEEDAYDIFLLHSAFISTHRSKKEKELLSMIGKNASRPSRKIIIGTQVMEQSLDIDFDVLITDLAPMDLLIQRIGRLHRHGIKRPDPHKRARVYLLGTDENFNFEDGTKHIYQPYILARTQYYLPDIIKIPGDISPLVQKVYGEYKLELDKEVEKVYQAFERQYNYYIEDKKHRAKVYLLSKAKQKERRSKINSIKGWLDGAKSNKDENEEKVMAQVRDIEPTLEVLALRKIGKGYGFFESEEDISGKVDDFQISLQIGRNSLKLPRILSQNYNIDKTIKILEEYNKRHLRSWQEDPWLKGSLGIIFDENKEFIIDDIRLKYSLEFGLEYERIKDE